MKLKRNCRGGKLESDAEASFETAEERKVMVNLEKGEHEVGGV